MKFAELRIPFNYKWTVCTDVLVVNHTFGILMWEIEGMENEENHIKKRALSDLL